ncbi:MAG: helix-turn-helix transcriptional regulator [Bacillota bacterium]
MENKVREYRKKEFIKVKDLAEAANVSLSMIYQIERGDKIPSLKVAQKIAHTLGYNTDRVFYQKE